MNIVDTLRCGSDALQQVGIDEYELDARLLLEHVLKKTRSQLFLAFDLHLTEEQFLQYRLLVQRREKREPVAYILGEQEFWSFTFLVTPDVLIPRPETEFLLEQVFSQTNKDNFSRGRILDLCCGSGVIATVLAKETGKRIIASDVSTKALDVSRRNIISHAVHDKVQLVQSDLLSAFTNRGQFSLVVSNPPYVSNIDVDNNLAPEVCDYEPRLALDGGLRGLEIIALIREQLVHALLPGGELFMEIGADQGQEVVAMFVGNANSSKEFKTVQVIKDYTGRDRVIHAIKSEG